MSVVYLTDQGATAHKKGERLVVLKKSDVILDIPLIHVEQLVVMGNVQLSAALITQMLLQEVDVAFFSSYGKYRGRLTPPALGFAQLRHRQYQVLGNAQTALPIAKQAIQAKLANQRRTLGRLAATAGSQVQATVLRATQTMQGIEGQVSAARDLDSLRGYEGSGAAAYFGGLKDLLPPGWGFNGRQYRPPPDAVNAALSFGYALLQSAVLGMVNLVGFDPYLGFFHTIDYNRPSLALDLMEEFRPVVVDAVVAPLFLRNQFTAQDFRREPGAKPGVYLVEDGRRRLIEAHEKQMATPVPYPRKKETTALRRVIEEQARHLANVVLGEAGSYQGYEG